MFEKLLKEEVDSTLIQLFRYSFTGSLATFLDIYCLGILTEFFQVHYLISAAIAYLIGVLANYFLSTTWVFNKKTTDKFWLEFIIFTLIGIIGLGFVVVIMGILTEFFHLHYFMSKFIATILVSLWNFFARKFLLSYQPGNWQNDRQVNDDIN